MAYHHGGSENETYRLSSRKNKETGPKNLERTFQEDWDEEGFPLDEPDELIFES